MCWRYAVGREIIQLRGSGHVRGCRLSSPNFEVVGDAARNSGTDGIRAETPFKFMCFIYISKALPCSRLTTGGIIPRVSKGPTSPSYAAMSHVRFLSGLQCSGDMEMLPFIHRGSSLKIGNSSHPLRRRHAILACGQCDVHTWFFKNCPLSCLDIS